MEEVRELPDKTQSQNPQWGQEKKVFLVLMKVVTRLRWPQASPQPSGHLLGTKTVYLQLEFYDVCGARSAFLCSPF